jgi:hypothetical protein
MRAVGVVANEKMSQKIVVVEPKTPKEWIAAIR